jgi:membrane protease YdiL (CAAX protease family)
VHTTLKKEEVVTLSEWIANISEWMGALAVAWVIAISPRFKKVPPVGFLYARRDGLAALVIYGLVLASSFIYYRYNPPAQGFNVGPDQFVFSIAAAPVTDLVHVLVIAGIGLIPVVVAMIVRRQPIRAVGWHQAILLPATLMGLGLAFITLILRNRFWELIDGVSSAEFFTLLTMLGIALAEETIFRGYILLRLAWWLGEWPGLVLTSLMYAAWHLPAWLGQQPLETILLLSLLTFIQGMVLGWLMRKSQHVLTPALYRAMSMWTRVLG